MLSLPPDRETAEKLRFAGITWVGLRHLLFLGIKNARPVKVWHSYLLSSRCRLRSQESSSLNMVFSICAGV